VKLYDTFNSAILNDLEMSFIIKLYTHLYLYTNSPGSRAYYYTERAVSSLAGVVWALELQVSG